ncbi:GtrA family protein [Frigoribacterium sp. CFBP 8754]|jgi:putative flippase GtrA|uniref:GtrA family protein n=1 Tax=unclassified Frigoribacterium TaxID=2627005 RepID=UPI00177ED9AD|nr:MULTISPECIES: GtrA family protein [unclassified Frigoribacterium]MBD8659005.1 GtrA family protein [Frigoribacterium sp. CFBP 8754]MBD8727300.1 GtrA family protein [Frigoribacterium sp. CFBP 13707]
MSRASDFLVEHLRRGSSFLVIGGVGFVVDALVYNGLVFWGGAGPLASAPLLAKVLAIAVASVVTYVGSRFWTFRDRGAGPTRRSFGAFAVVNVVAILLQLACLGFSRYVLGLDGPVADNVSGTLVGQALATGFRYVAYGRWVFPRAATTESAGTAQSTR